MNDATGMSRAEVLSSILSLELSQCQLTVCLASLQDVDQLPVFATLQLSDGLANEFRDVVRTVFKRFSGDLAEGELLLHAYEPGTTLDAHEIEHIHLPDHPAIAEQFASLSNVADIPVFQETEEFVSGLRFYVILVQPPQGEYVYCFRSYSAKKELRRSVLFAALFADGHFDRVSKPMFLFDQYLDCVSRGNDLFIFKKDAFQKIFRFFEMVRKVAKKTLATIRKAVPIENFDEFEKACEGHLQKLAKLNNIASKPYLKAVTMTDIKKVIRKFSLPVTVVKRNGKEMLLFDPKDRWSLLRLLDDDYLGSVMTGQNYEVRGKRVVQ